MKFVCDNCNAKYQIGDDKVAGKTLRMKCRRCGHMIQVAATVTESSVSQKLPTEPAAGSVPESLEGGPSEEGATIVRPSPLFLFQDGKAPGPAAGSPINRPLGSPAPGSSALGAVAPDARRAPPPGGGIPRPVASQMGGSPMGAPRIVPPARPSLRASSPPPAPSPQRPEPAPIHAPSSPGLFSGFAAAVAAPQARTGDATSSAAPLPTEDWYVGVGGVPLGPVRLSVVREKAAQGQVDQDSLVWREGFDEWLPVKAFPALLALVDEVKHARTSRTSLPTPNPPFAFTPSPAANSPAANSPTATASNNPPAPAANPFAAQQAPSGSLAAAARALAASAPSSPASGAGSQPSVPEPAASIPFDLVQGGLGAQGGARQSSPTGPGTPSRSSLPAVADPFAVKDPFAPANGVAAASSAQRAPAEGASTAMGYGMTTTAAVTGGISPSTGAALKSDAPPASAVAVDRKKKGVHPAIWAFVAMAAAFGGVAAWALFLRKPDVVYVPKEGETVPVQPVGAAPPPPPTGATPEVTGTAQQPPQSESGAPIAIGTGTQKGGPLGVPSGKGTETAPPIDTSGFGTSGPTGPNTADTSTGKGNLNEGQLNAVVSSNSARVRRKCWDPLVAGRSSDAPSSVKVTATVKIAPSGSVKSVSTSGGNEKHYPGLTSCVQSTVSSWTFPASDEGGTVVVPFGFNAQ